MRVIQLTQGQHTVVADDVYAWASKFEWYAKKDGRTFYAVRNIRLPDGRQANVYLHREIMKVSKGEEVDHQDGDGLHNLPENLRTCSRLENTQNRSIRRDNTSGFKGVSFDRVKGKWSARIQIAGQPIFLGLFDQAIDAAKEYDRAALAGFGEFAKTNFPA